MTEAVSRVDLWLISCSNNNNNTASVCLSAFRRAAHARSRGPVPRLPGASEREHRRRDRGRLSARAVLIRAVHERGEKQSINRSISHAARASICHSSLSAGARSAHGHVSGRGSQSGRVSSSGRDAGPAERWPSGSPVRAAADRAGSDVTTTDHVT